MYVCIYIYIYIYTYIHIYTLFLFLFRATSLCRRSHVGRRALIRGGETCRKDGQQRKVGQKDDPLSDGLVWGDG